MPFSCGLKILTSGLSSAKSMGKKTFMMVIKAHVISHRKSFRVLNLIEQTSGTAWGRYDNKKQMHPRI